MLKDKLRAYRMDIKTDRRIIQQAQRFRAINHKGKKIPETKIVLMNKDFYIVQEDLDEIIEKIIEFNAKITDLNKRIQIVQD